jgi:hypothetical protein
MTFTPPALAAALPRPSASAVRYQIPVTATADAGGNATFTFPDAPEGQWQVGTITIAAAPANAAFLATVVLQPWGVWNGPAPSPVVQVDPRSHVAVTADFLAPAATYVAWFIGWSDVLDALIYPTESVTPTQQSVTLLSGNASAPAGVVTIPISSTPTPWLQTLVIRVLSVSGVSNGLLLTVTDPSTAPFRTDFFAGSFPFQYEQFVYVPVGGRPSTIQIQAMVNGAPVATAQTFFVEVLGSAIFVPTVTLGDLPSNFGTAQGLGIQFNCAATTTVTAIPTNPTGTVVRIRGVGVQFVTAPVAAGGVLLVGGISARGYWRRQSPAAVNEIFDFSTWLVAQSGLADPTEGLSFTNNLSVTATISIRYDLIPYTLGAAAP